MLVNNFGIINDYLHKIHEILELNLTKLNYLNFNLLKQYIYKELKIDKNIIDDICERLVSVKYNLNKKLSFTNGKNCFREYEDKYPDIEVPEEYKKLEQHFNKLKLLPQPEQRTKEWYDYRYNRITASDTAAAIDQNPYEPVEGFILKKCDPNFPFRDNAAVSHGKKYEPIATMIYEHIYNTRVFEFGALPSEKYEFLGASPDGICSKYTLDNEFSTRLGTMLEIKCPVTRNIILKGKIIGEICPNYYYWQIQQQLECCDLDVCDFLQCKLSEYNNRNEYLIDTCESCKHYETSNGNIVDIDNRLKKGVIIELYPKIFKPEFEGDNIEWKSKYIYPKRLDMDEEQYNNWILKTLSDNTDELYNNYYFHKIIYWKLILSHNVAIQRCPTSIQNILPILKETWSKVQYYRKNKDKLPELQLICDKRKKYIKINTSYTIHTSMLDNINFLDDKFDLKTINKNIKILKKKDIESDSYDD